MLRPKYDPIHPDEPTINPSEGFGLTTNYEFLLFNRGTPTGWLQGFNVNMNKLDAIIHALQLRSSIDGEVPPEAINDIIKLNEEVASMKEEIQTLQERSADYGTRITTLETDSATQGADIATLKQNYINADVRLTTMATQISSIEDTLQKLQTNYTALEARVAALEQNGG